MQVREIMSPNVESIDADSPLQEASMQLASIPDDHLLVVARKQLVGILTEESLQSLAECKPSELLRGRVADAMETKVVGCYEETEVEDAASVMRSENLDELPVVNGFSTLVGRLRAGDLRTSKRGPQPGSAVVDGGRHDRR